jgi:hypothetical protein
MERQGGCTCGSIRYEISEDPIFLQACHCTHCQTSTGSAFITTWISEAQNLHLLQGEPKVFDTFTGGSGGGYDFYTCGDCGTGLWATVKGWSNGLLFLRAGTLDETRDINPMAHIYTKSKQGWVILPDGIPQFEEGYEREELWPPPSLARLQSLMRSQT